MYEICIEELKLIPISKNHVYVHLQILSASIVFKVVTWQ